MTESNPIIVEAKRYFIAHGPESYYVVNKETNVVEIEINQLAAAFEGMLHLEAALDKLEDQLEKYLRSEEFKGVRSNVVEIKH